MSDGALLPYDKDTEYRADDNADGFSLTIHYSRYQFIPESGALAIACRQALTSLAYNLAEKRGRQIERIEEQRIQLSMGRNGLSGVTSCSAAAPVKWASK